MTRFAWMFLGVLAVVLTVMAPSTLDAAETDLAKVLPGPSVLYVGWSGCDAVGAEFEKTAFGKLWAEPEIVKLREALCPQLSAMIKKRCDEGAGGHCPVHDPAKEMLGILSKHPGAINVMRLMLTRKGVEVEAAAVFDLGADVERFAEILEGLLKELIGEGEGAGMKALAVGSTELEQYSLGGGLPPVTWGRCGEYYLVTLGTQTPKKVVENLTGTSESRKLAEYSAFADARKGLAMGSGAHVLDWHLSITEIVRRAPLVATVIDFQRKQAGAKPSGRMPLGILVSRAIRALGLREIKSLAGAVTMQDEGFRIAWFLHAPGQKDGLMRFFHQKPLTDDDLALVPRDASYFYATNLDLHGFYDEVMTALKEVDPNMHQDWVDLLAEGERVVDVKLVEDVLAPLDDGWVLYTDPNPDGPLETGLTMLIEAKDAPHAERTITALAQSIVEHIGGAEAKLETAPLAGGGVVRFVEAEFPPPFEKAAPAWASHGNRVVLGLNRSMVEAAVRRLRAGELPATSILRNEDFAARRKFIPAGSNAVGYLDARYVIGGLYRELRPMLESALPGLAEYGLTLDASLLPSADTLERHLFGMVTGLTATDEGVLMVSHAPLPLPTPTFRSGAVVLAGLGAYWYYEQVETEAAFSELRGIGKACHVYAARHEEEFPSSLSVLTEQGLLTGGAWLDKYEYIPGLTPYAPTNCILAYDKVVLEAGESEVRVLDVTGRCRHLSVAQARAAIEATRKHLAEKAKTEANP